MPRITKRFSNAVVSAVVLAALFFFWLTPFFAGAQDSILPFYRVSVDIQKPQEQFFIDRTFYGNQAFLAFDIFDGNDAQEQPLAWTNTANWTFNVSYAYDQYDTGKYYIAQSSIISNRVYFLGATNLWFSPRDNYFVELIGTHVAGYVKTFGQGFMNQDFSPGADSNVTVQMGAYNLSWWTNNVGQMTVSNATRIAALETSTWTSVRTILTNTTWSASIVTQQLVIQIVTNAPGSGTSTGIVALTIGGGLLSSTNTSTGTVVDVTLTTNAVQIAMSGLFLTYTQGFGGDMTGPFSNLQIAAGAVGTTELDTNVNARLTEAQAAYAWGSWSQGIYGATSDFYLNTNGQPQIRTGAVTTVEILDATIAAGDIATNVPLTTFTNPDGLASTSAVLGVWVAVTNLQGLVSTQLLAQGVINTNASTALGTASNALRSSIGLGVTNHAGLGLAFTNQTLAQGVINTNVAGYGITNDARVGLVEANFASAASNEAYDITSTNTKPQRVLSDFNADALLASTTVGAACTNCGMSTNMLVNGSFAAGGAFWTFGGGANSNAGSGGQLLVAGNTSGTAVQSNQFAASAGPWELSYTNTATDATGSVVVSFGGYDHVQAGALTGLQAWIIYPQNTNGYLFTANVTGSTAGAWKNLTLKKIFTGTVGGVYGSFDYLNVSNATIKGTVTAASFSGGNTGYLALVTGGAVLGQTVVSNNFLSGSYNIISAGGVFNAIVGGIYNRTEDDFSFIGGGYSNIAEANYVGVIAGRENNINGDYSAIIAGKFNMVGGENSVAIGGRSNVVNGTDSIGAGVDAVAGYTRSFVWSDGMTNDFGSTASNQFAVHASGGIRLAGGPIYGDGTGLSNLPAGSITGALPAIDGSLLTGVIAAGTNSVSAIKVSEATNTYVGTVPLNSSATIQFSATATGPTASVLSGALTGINGAGVTGPVAITSLQAIPVLTVAVTSAESTWDASTKTLTLDTNDSGAASGVTLLNGTNGSVTIDAGSNIAVTRTNGNINIAGSAGGSGATQAIATVGSSTVTSTISGATLSWSNAAAASGGASVYAPYATNSIAPTGGSHTVSAATKDSAILSGINHTLSGWGNVILGGWNNKNDALFGAVVGGGYLCGISNGVYYSATLGGVYSYILSDNSYVGPGESCRILATSPYSVVGGGLGNYVAANSAKSVVGGGQDNIGGAFSVTAGGQGNSTAGGTAAAVSGGANNLVDGSYSSVAGGRVNVVHANHSFVGGGDYQTIDSLSHYSAILGGGNNSISNSAKGNIVLGGYNNNVATGVEMSVVWGERANAKHSGSFVLADNRHGEPNGYTDAWETVSTIQSNEFIGRFKNGMHLTPDGDGTTNRWDVTGLKIVTNANVFLYAPGWVGSQLLDVGSNRVYYALGMTTNDWKGTNLN